MFLTEKGNATASSPRRASDGPRETAPVPETTDPGSTDEVQQLHAHFEHPAAVVVDPRLSRDEKVRALEEMEQDAKQLSTATAEGMTGGEEGDLRSVRAAKEALDLPPFALAVSAVLQEFKARLRAPEWSEAHALIAHAIDAVEAASRAMGTDSET